MIKYFLFAISLLFFSISFLDISFPISDYQYFFYDELLSTKLKIEYPTNWSYFESYNFQGKMVQFFPQDNVTYETIAQHPIGFWYIKIKDNFNGILPKNPSLNMLVVEFNKLILKQQPLTHHKINLSLLDRTVSAVNETVIGITDKGVEYKSKIYFFIDGIDPVIIVMKTPINEVNKYESIFDHMLNSMKIYLER